MHRPKDPVNESDDGDAFEFVLGTLTEHEKRAYLERRARNPALLARQQFWEAQLQALQPTTDTLTPKKQTWDQIERFISQAPTAHVSRHSESSAGELPSSEKSRRRASSEQTPFWRQWLSWGAAAVAASFFTSMIFFFVLMPRGELPVDYVAVLTGEDGKAKLSAVTEGESQAMWLQWDEVAIAPDQDLQLWALSKTDGETRSLAVFDDAGLKQIELSEANWRLVKDAELLILTAEEVGGSPMDEPSEQVIATGYCVRLESDEKSS